MRDNNVLVRFIKTPCANAWHRVCELALVAHLLRDVADRGRRKSQRCTRPDAALAHCEDDGHLRTILFLSRSNARFAK
jgi:hypothetical protein